MTPEIGFIVPYFGQWPHWISYYLKSCETNTSFHWFIITDLEQPVRKLPNVHFVPMSLKELTDRISNQLQINPVIRHPYKLVDFKPAFGIIFEDILQEFPYWGYTDLDLIYGNLSHFFTKDILWSYDIISPNAEFVPGHFSVFRNNTHINHLFKICPNWKEIFQSLRCFCFDEYLYAEGLELNDIKIQKFTTWKIRKHHLLKTARRSLFLQPFRTSYIGKSPHAFSGPKDFNGAIERESKHDRLRLYGRTMYADDAMQPSFKKALRKTAWKNGSLFLDGKEILYYHFQMAKYHKNFSVISDPEGHIQFMI